MKLTLILNRALAIAILGSFTSGNFALAQIIPDGTLPNNSSVANQGNITNITGGTRAGSNLFHSFEKFSVPTKGVAYFNNALDVQNIISRVTGGSISNIDGLIKANGTANFFLLNPSGIIFGPNASLNIGGSFLGTTANSINFADGSQFSATTPQTAPLLTISVPIGLQFGANSGKIVVQGDGQGTRVEVKESPLIDTTAGLHVESNQTLALVGSDVTLEGGTLKTVGGRIELGSLAGPSLVSLTPIGKGWALGYDGIQSFGDIHLSQQAAIDASGAGGGDIQVQGRQVTLTDASQIEASTLRSEAGGRLSVNASDSVELSGTSANGYISALSTEVYPGATGPGGSLSINTGHLNISGGGQVFTSTSGSGNGGTLSVSASDSVQVMGTSADGMFPSSLTSRTRSGATGVGGNLTVTTGKLMLSGQARVSTDTYGTRAAGNLTINTGTLLVKDGSQVSADTFGQGNGGTLSINTGTLLVKDGSQVSAGTFGQGNGGTLSVSASDSMQVMGTSADGMFPSGLFTTAEPGATGSAGNLTVTTGKLMVSNGGQLSTSTFGPGNGGSLSVSASDSVQVMGTSANGESRSGLLATAELGATGAAGNLTIATQTLSVLDDALVSTDTSGTGAAGNLTISTGKLRASNGAEIRTSSFGPGNGGTLSVSASDSVQLSGVSPNEVDSTRLSSQTNSSGDAGELRIDTDRLTVDDGAQILANTSGQGNGGKIQVNANSVNLSGTGSNGRSSGLFTSSSVLEEGGDVTIDSNTFRVSNGAVVSAITLSKGNAGNVTVKANTFEADSGGQIRTTSSGSRNAGNIDLNISNSLTLSGSDPTYTTRLVNFGSNVVRNEGSGSGVFADTTPGSTGTGGTISIDPTKLTLTDGASIAVSNLGEGKAGNLNIQAGTVSLDRGSSITAATASGQGGNIFLHAQDLRLLHNSLITASAGGTKNGGNINIDTATLAGLQGSRIAADAVGGTGGQVNINASALFMPLSQITATSNAGPKFNGTVRINTPYIDFTRASANPVTPPQAPQVSSVCSSRAGSTTGKVVNTGTGGTPPSSDDALSSNTGWHDNSITPQSDENVRKQAPTIDKKPLQFVQAQGWIRRPNGIVSLVAEPPGTILSNFSSPCYRQAQKNTAENK